MPQEAEDLQLTELAYAGNRQDILMAYLEDGRCSLSNNMSENAVRPVVVGRKNWLFSDTMDGAEASMGIYTIMEMAKLQGLDSYKYMKYILESQPDYKSSDEELEKLAPWSDRVQEICRELLFKYHYERYTGPTVPDFLCLYP